MKKIILITLLITVSLISVCFAEDVDKQEKRYTALFSTDDILIWLIDNNSIKVQSDKNVEVWSKVFYTAKGKQDIYDKYDKIKTPPVGYVKSIIDYKNKRFRHESLKYYVKENMVAQENYPVVWASITPDTNAASIYDTVLEYIKAHPDKVALRL